jgi:microcystin-dependent protein
MTKKIGNYGGDVSTVSPNLSRAPGGWNSSEANYQQSLDSWPLSKSRTFLPAGSLVYLASSGVADTRIAAGDVLIPSGQLLSRVAYSDLFTTWGEVFDAGDTVTTFGAPNMIRPNEQYVRCVVSSGLSPTSLHGSGVVPIHTHDVNTGYATTGAYGNSTYGVGNPQYYTFSTALSGSLAGNVPKRVYLTPSFTTRGQSLQVGSIVPLLLGSTEDVIDVIPNSTMMCMGQEVSRVLYADLYSLIGNTYGSGDGSTTFNLPDLRGVFVGHPYPNPKQASGTLYLVDEFASHRHTVTAYGHGGVPLEHGNYSPLRYSDSGLTTNGTITGTENRPNNFTSIYCLVVS